MSLYRVIRLIGSSPNSWDEAAKSALEEAATHLEDLRVAEVEQLDVRMKENKVVEYRARVRYPVHAITRKSLGDMTRKLSVTESHRSAQFRGTVSRRKSRVASANWVQVA